MLKLDARCVQGAPGAEATGSDEESEGDGVQLSIQMQIESMGERMEQMAARQAHLLEL